MNASRRILLAALAVASAPVATASAGVETGTSGWQWGNPLPQGNQLQAMAFAGPTGYASGAFGTLLKTVDGGTTWSGLRTGTAQALDQVQAVDADTVVTGGGCVARLSTNGGQSFSRIAFTPVESSCDQPLKSLSFVSKDTGFLLLADGSVLQTTDGGQTFTPRTAVPGSRAAGGGSPGRSSSSRPRPRLSSRPRRGIGSRRWELSPTSRLASGSSRKALCRSVSSNACSSSRRSTTVEIAVPPSQNTSIPALSHTASCSAIDRRFMSRSCSRGHAPW